MAVIGKRKDGVYLWDDDWREEYQIDWYKGIPYEAECYYRLKRLGLLKKR